MSGTSLDGIRVLIVEDEILVAMLLEDMLVQLGCVTVATVGRIDAAHDAIAAHPIDVAILDLNLHGHKTTPLADALADRSVPFIFATGYGARDIDPHHRHRPVLSKPFLEDDLAAALARALAG